MTYAPRIHRYVDTVLINLTMNWRLRLAWTVSMFTLSRKGMEQFGLGATSEQAHSLKHGIHLQDVKPVRAFRFVGLRDAA
jgi:hypothetical protein